MSSAILIVLTILLVVTALWEAVRIWRSSPAGAVLTFLLGVPGWYYLYKYWNDEEKDIRVPFFVNLGVLIVYLVAMLNSVEVLKEMHPDDEVASAEVARTKFNPEMDRWCREKHDAVWDNALGTCVEPEPGQKLGQDGQGLDVMERLGKHFSENGLAVSLSEVDESRPGARKIANLPGMRRMMQFEITGKSANPTLVMVGECVSAAECGRIVKNLNQPDAPVSVARNGKLVFFGFHMFGDTGKMERAKDLFNGFQAQPS